MIKITTHSKARLADPRVLAHRAGYIENEDHPDHAGKGKLVLPSVNVGCHGQDLNDFLKATHQAYELGQQRIDNQTGGGNPNKDLFLELIYSSPEGALPTEEERDQIINMILAQFRGCHIRYGWHLADPDRHSKPKRYPGKELCNDVHDCHILISARDRYGNATLASRFGDGKQTFVSWRNQIDQQICDMLNSTREVSYEPVHTIHRRNLETRLGTTFTKLYKIIAHATAEIVTRANLVEVIRNLGHRAEPINDDDKVVNVTFDGRQTSKKFRIEKLLLNIAETQLDNELSGQGGNSSAGGSGGGGGLVEPAKCATSTKDDSVKFPSVFKPQEPTARKKPARKKSGKSKSKSPPSIE